MEADEANIAEEKLGGIFVMLDLLKCVSCSDLPFEKVWTPGNCCHKYCKSCLNKLALKECVECQVEINPKDREVDLFSTNLISQLLQLMRAVDPDAEYQAKRWSGKSDGGKERSAHDLLVEDEDGKENGIVGLNKKSKTTKEMTVDSIAHVEEVEEDVGLKKKGKSPVPKVSERKGKLARRMSKAKSIDTASVEEGVQVEVKQGKTTGLTLPVKCRASKKSKPVDDRITSGEMLAKLFASDSSDNEGEELPSLTPHPPTEGVKSRAVSREKSTLKEKPLLECEVSLKKLQSPSTRSRSRNSVNSTIPVSKKRRNLEEEFKNPNKDVKSATPTRKDSEGSFLKPEPKVESSSKFFLSRNRSSSANSNSEDELGKLKSESKKDSVKEIKKQRLIETAESKQRSSSPVDDIYDFKSQSKKVVPKKKGKGKRKRNDSGSSTASSISIASVKKEVLTTPRTNDKGGRQNSSTGTSAKSSPGINKKNAKGETLLHVAVRTGKLEKVQELIENGANVDAKDFAGWAPLHEAINAKKPTLEMVQLLCQSNADVNALGMGNETPIHEAARIGLADILKYLLSQGASAAIRNSAGKLPKDYAEKRDIKAIFKEHEEEMKGQSQSNDLSVELKVSLQKAVYYFAYNVPKEVLKSAKSLWDMKITSELTKKVTHVIFDAKPKTKVPLNFDFLVSILNGCWILSSKWLEDSLSVKRFLDPRKYQLNGCVYDNVPSSTGDDVAVERARVNHEHGNPSLFHGFSFYIYKNTNWPSNVKGGKSTISLNKKDIGKLIQFGDGVVINREPNPEMVDPLENPSRFHACHDDNITDWNSEASVQDHKLVLTSHVILYDDKNVPPVKHDLEHVKTLKIDWLIHSAVHFRLLHPDSYL